MLPVLASYISRYISGKASSSDMLPVLAHLRARCLARYVPRNVPDVALISHIPLEMPC
jgi:hypothetical protein